MNDYTGSESPYDDGTNAPELSDNMRAWTGLTGGNKTRTLLTDDPLPGKFTVTLEEWRKGKRP